MEAIFYEDILDRSLFLRLFFLRDLNIYPYATLMVIDAIITYQFSNIFENKGEEEMKYKNQETKIHEYKNNDLIIYWTPSACTHSQKCITGLPAVFNPMRRPWVNINEASSEDLIRSIDECPSGALRYSLTENSKLNPELANGRGSINFHPKEYSSVIIKTIDHGPLIVEGTVKIIGQDDKLIQECNNAALCCCGRSRNKPFCDGSHRDE